MTARQDESTTSLSYILRCVDCSFEATVQGDAYDVLDVIDVHQEKYGDDARRHFVEFESEELE